MPNRSFYYIYIIFIFLFSLEACSEHSILNPIDNEGILLVAFGTNSAEARQTYKKIESQYEKSFPNKPIEWAFTSNHIRGKLNAAGEKTASIGEALDRLAKNGINRLRIQSLHIATGEEFFELVHAILYYINKRPNSFKEVYLGQPLLVSRKDGLETAKAIENSLDVNNADAVVLMAHGQKEGKAGLILEGVDKLLKEQNPAYFLATVDGETNLSALIPILKKSNVKTVFLAPFMLVAGNHARKELLGKENNSWISQLENAGFKISGSSLKGLGDDENIVDIFIRHTKDEKKNLVAGPKKL